jgi:hypothetical protein
MRLTGSLARSAAWYCQVEELQVSTEVLASIHLHVTIRQK